MSIANLSANLSTDQVAETIRTHLSQQGLTITSQDLDRPWGGFFMIDETQIPEFIDIYFPHDRGKINDNGEKLSPKILLIAPGKRLSWQYHHRRAEFWKVVSGPVAIYLSHTDFQPDTPQTFTAGDVIALKRSMRHRLQGLDNWAIVAEIWSHTHPEQPSDENDIVRLADDFGRETPTQ